MNIEIDAALKIWAVGNFKRIVDGLDRFDDLG